MPKYAYHQTDSDVESLVKNIASHWIRYQQSGHGFIAKALFTFRVLNEVKSTVQTMQEKRQDPQK